MLPAIALLTGCTQTTGIVLTASIAIIEGFIILYVLATKPRKRELKTALKDLISFGHAEPIGIDDLDEALCGVEHNLDLLKHKLQESREIQNEILIAQGRFQLAHRLMRAGMLSASMAHDLRGPLSGIIGSASLLKDMPDQPKELLEKHASNILHQAEACVQVIDNLLQQTRTEAVDRKTCNISLTAKKSVDACINMSHADAMPHIDIQENLFSLVDCTQVWQVFQNLVLNAIEATDKKGNIWVGLTKKAQRIVFFVEDDGPGIDESDRARIFDPLYTEKKSGTGMGLVIVKMYVEANQGTIEVGKSAHGGACFEVSFPEHKPENQVNSAQD